ncbi:class I SAM-dependent methyltransferase [Lysobacter sp. M2-1]|uniref:class I SAM-dependent methyltransferase n=1 Tax=Lysobacter sp. M2-1 TaxID=2916839 RepID=UPI001F5AC3E4|nr:class I SAM-dependent methyltransferase [Lysobacter sp. M2-1]
MAQYQSFPDATGDSRTLEKLKALRLPPLAGKRFLDVGCNEGFFCGYALFDGALRAVGIDSSALFISRARRRFPAGEFLHQGWEELPDGPFDVILLASALHYAEDQPGLIRSLVARLAHDGVLVLELGIASSPKEEWVNVERGIDERLFPTMPLLRRLLNDYAWKWMGPSVAQSGDPVARHVIHVYRRRPIAYLLMEPPAYGKTSIATGLFAEARIPVVSGDSVIADLAAGKRSASDALRNLLADRYSPFRIDELVREAFDHGGGGELVDAWVSAAEGETFALDGYVPAEWQDYVKRALIEAGYMPVAMHWERVGAALPAAADRDASAENYFLHLSEELTEAPSSEGPDSRLPMQGFIDEVSVEEGFLVIRGWVVGQDGKMPRCLQIRSVAGSHLLEEFERQLRPDVQKYLGLPHAVCGYRVRVPLAGKAVNLAKLVRTLEVRAGNGANSLGPALTLAGHLALRSRG